MWLLKGDVSNADGDGDATCENDGDGDNDDDDDDDGVDGMILLNIACFAGMMVPLPGDDIAEIFRGLGIPQLLAVTAHCGRHWLDSADPAKSNNYSA